MLCLRKHKADSLYDKLLLTFLPALLLLQVANVTDCKFSLSIHSVGC